jgi:hypothetical protein
LTTAFSFLYKLVKMKYIKVEDEEYEVVPDEARMLTDHLVHLSDKLGLPDDLTVHDMTPSAWVFVERVVTLWRHFYPREYYDWVQGMEVELKYERPVREAVKGGGYSPIAYPMRVYRLLNIFFPKLKLQDKEFTKKFIRVVPAFKNTNYKI